MDTAVAAQRRVVRLSFFSAALLTVAAIIDYVAAPPARGRWFMVACAILLWVAAGFQLMLLRRARRR